jgi:hypothetical protein
LAYTNQGLSLELNPLQLHSENGAGDEVHKENELPVGGKREGMLGNLGRQTIWAWYEGGQPLFLFMVQCPGRNMVEGGLHFEALPSLPSIGLWGSERVEHYLKAAIVMD